MSREKDRSLFYSILSGFLLCLLIIGSILFYAYHNSNGSPAYGPVYTLYPEGAETITSYDSHGGFHGDGNKVMIVQIPQEFSSEFCQSLMDVGFVDDPVPEDIVCAVHGELDTYLAADISNGLWWFYDGSSDGLDYYANYKFHIYDIDSSIYYYVECDT